MVVLSLSNDSPFAEEFVQVPYRLHRDNCRYVAPQMREQWEFVKADSLLYRDTGIQACHFLACSGSMAVGRVSAFVNPRLRDDDGEPVGTIGLFECIDDYTVAERLLREAMQWLRQRHGLTRIWGPMNADIWHGYRFKTKGYDQETFVGEPQNPDYYPRFFERFGFQVKREWDSLVVDGPERVRQMIVRGEARLNLLLKQGYRFEWWNPLRREAQIAELHAVLTPSFSRFPGFTPISREQFTPFFQRLEAVLDPELFLLTYDPEGACVGFAVAFPDMVNGVRAMHGKETLAAKVSYLLHRDRHPRLNFYIGGITPEQETKRTGLGRAGFYVLLNRALQKGYTTVMLTLRLKGNEAHGLAARSGVVPQHEYALYEYRYDR